MPPTKSLFPIEPVLNSTEPVSLTPNERVQEVIQLAEIAKTIRGGKLMFELGTPSLDLQQILSLFNRHRVEYLVVGGYAIAYHGHPRLTGSLDLFYRQTPENASRILAALHEAGFANISLTKEDLLHPQLNHKLGRPPNQIDLNPDVKGVRWDAAILKAVGGEILGQPVKFLDFDTLIDSKRAAGRTQDIADIEALMRNLGGI